MNETTCFVRSKRSTVEFKVNNHYCHEICLYQHPEDYEQCHPALFEDVGRKDK